MTVELLESIRSSLIELTDLVETATRSEPRLMDETEAGRYIGMSTAYLRKARCEGSIGERTQAPVHLKIGNAVRYDKTDLDRWIDEQKRHR